jgi:hypothetical protein
MREPLLHFILLGIAIFALHRLVAEDGGAVEITPEQVAVAERDFARRTGRQPDERERAVILDGLIEEEVLVAEGAALSLAEGDEVLRRRLIARMRLLLASTAPAQPDDDDLAALLAAHPERYVRPDTVTFRHVFIDAARHVSPATTLRHVEARLLAGEPEEALGDPFLHGRRMVSADAADIAGMLGADFAAEVLRLPAGEWLPVRSSFGEHLVYIEAHHPSRPQTLEEARAALTADWQRDSRAAAEAEALAAIRARYRVITP